jgi:hypothetical protein
MKKAERAQRLPKFKATTLRVEDLKQVTGGLMLRGSLACTAGTQSVCHVDGTTDGDSYKLPSRLGALEATPLLGRSF